MTRSMIDTTCPQCRYLSELAKSRGWTAPKCLSCAPPRGPRPSILGVYVLFGIVLFALLATAIFS